MRTIIQRYLGANFILPFMVSCIFFVVFLLIFQMSNIMKLLVNKDIDIATIFQIVSSIAISFVPLSLPLSVLFASIYSLSKLSSDAEFMAMKSLGFSTKQIVTPFIIIGIFIAITIFSVGMNIIPHSKRQFREIVTQLTTKGILTDIKEGKFFTDVKDITMYADTVTDKGHQLKNVFIHVFNNDKKEEKVVLAKYGKFITKKIDNIITFTLQLNEGNIVQYSNKTHQLEKILFQEYFFPLNNKNLYESFGIKDSMLTTSEIYQTIRPTLFQFTAKKEQKIIKLELEFFERINSALICPVFMILGFCLGIQRTRGANRNSATLCFGVLIIYYAILFTGISLARKGTIPSSMALFLPTFLALMVTSYLFRKLKWLA